MIDISKKHPTPLTTHMVEEADYIISMGCGVDIEKKVKKLIDEINAKEKSPPT